MPFVSRLNLLRFRRRIYDVRPARADAADLHNHFLVLRAIVVDLARCVNGEATDGNGCGFVGIERFTFARPPRAFYHRDITRWPESDSIALILYLAHHQDQTTARHQLG